MASTYALVVGTFSNHLHDLELRVEDDTATLSKVDSTHAPNCSFLHIDGDTLFATSELENEPGGVRKFVKEKDGWKEQWYADASSEGTCQCSIVYKHSKRYILAAHYVGHTIDIINDAGKVIQTINFEGSGPFEGRQESAHCHQIIQDPASGYIYLCDLGGDKVHQYELYADSHGDEPQLRETGLIKLEPAQGPRHLTFNSKHPSLLYIICELSNDITIYKHNSQSPSSLAPAASASESASTTASTSSGSQFERVQVTSILPRQDLGTGQLDAFTQPASGAEIRVTPDGKFIYASVRYLPHADGDTIYIGRIDDTSNPGLIATGSCFQTGLRAPWHLSFNHDASLVAVAFQVSNVVVVYKRDRETGELVYLTQLTNIEKPSCVLFLETERDGSVAE